MHADEHRSDGKESVMDGQKSTRRSKLKWAYLVAVHLVAVAGVLLIGFMIVTRSLVWPQWQAQSTSGRSPAWQGEDAWELLGVDRLTSFHTTDLGGGGFIGLVVHDRAMTDVYLRLPQSDQFWQFGREEQGHWSTMINTTIPQPKDFLSRQTASFYADRDGDGMPEQLIQFEPRGARYVISDDAWILQRGAESTEPDDDE
jgi:hypothetical protein